MKKHILLLTLALTSALCAFGASYTKAIVFRGDTLEHNFDFTRKSVGYTPKDMPEISGMACSRVTPDYLWAQSDDNYRVIAMTEKGKMVYDLTLTNKPSRSDWEDMCIGKWQGKSTIFVGGFGDNNLKKNDKYYVFYFSEPAIPVADTVVRDTIDVNGRYILYGYPDSVAHDTESMMYDNVDNILYIVDKSDRGVNTVYKLPMDTVYGNDLVRLTEVCKLGIEGETQFCRATAADMTPDGHWIIIKNYDVYLEKAYALLWERKDGESVDDALMRQPQQIAAYRLEAQGEAVAWKDEKTFFTTSDDDGSATIYIYTRWDPASVSEIDFNAVPSSNKVMINGQIYIRQQSNLYDLQGQPIK